MGKIGRRASRIGGICVLGQADEKGGLNGRRHTYCHLARLLTFTFNLDEATMVALRIGLRAGQLRGSESLDYVLQSLAVENEHEDHGTTK